MIRKLLMILAICLCSFSAYGISAATIAAVSGGANVAAAQLRNNENTGAHSSRFLQALIGKEIDGCKVIEAYYSEVQNEIRLLCVKNSKIYRFYADVELNYQCGKFTCDSKNATKEVVGLLNEVMK